MAVIRSDRRGFDDPPARKRPNMAFRLLNIAFSVVVAVALWGYAGTAVLAGIDGLWPERLAVLVIAVSAGLGGALIVSHAFRDANPVSLVLIFPMAALFAFLVDYLGALVFMDLAWLNRLRGQEVIDHAMFFGAAYLLIWERGARTDAGSDDIIDTLRSFGAVWPMLLVIACLVVVEYLTW